MTHEERTAAAREMLSHAKLMSDDIEDQVCILTGALVQISLEQKSIAFAMTLIAKHLYTLSALMITRLDMESE